MRAMGLLPGRTRRRRGEAGMQPHRRGSESSPGSSRSSSAQAGPTRRALPAQSSRSWELPEGNFRAPHVCKGIWNKVMYGNIETWQPAREWWNGQTQIKSSSMIWSHYQTESLHSPGEFTKWRRSRIAEVFPFGWHENQETSAIRTVLRNNYLILVQKWINFLTKST